MTLIDQIRDLIAEGETQRSLDELYKYVKENNADVIDNLVMLRGRMQNLQRSVNNGTMDDQSAALERAKINEAILKLLPQLTPEYLAQATQRREPLRPVAVATPSSDTAAPPRDMKKIYLIAGGALLVVVLLIVMLGGGGNSDEGEQQMTDGSESATENWTPPEGTLLYNVVANHAGHAVWKSVYNETNGQSIFRMENEKTWQEIKNNQVVNQYELTETTSEYVEIYDASRSATLRIFDTEAHFKNEGDPEWYVLAEGEWVTPPDAQ